MKSKKGINMIIPGFILMLIIGPTLCFMPLGPLGGLLMAAGLLMVIFSGGNYANQGISYDSHDEHYHLHQHNYPNQKYSEGSEYTITETNGNIHTIRKIKRLD